MHDSRSGSCLKWTSIEEDSVGDVGRVRHVPSAEVDAGWRPGTSAAERPDLVVFRVAHHHPHRLKRPLQHSDRLGYGDLALRIYGVAASQEVDGLPRLRVQRAETPDIQLVDLFGFGSTSLTTNQLITKHI